ncbi:hypothetical protein [Nonomuraea sp. NPDC049480]
MTVVTYPGAPPHPHSGPAFGSMPEGEPGRIVRAGHAPRPA